MSSATAVQPAASRGRPGFPRRRLRGATGALVLGFGAVGLAAMILAPRGALAQDAVPAGGFEAGDVVIRGRLSAIFAYNQKSSIDQIGGRIEVSRMLLPDLDASLFLSRHWSVTGQAGLLNVDIRLKDTLYGDIDIGSVWVLPASLALQYHVGTDWGFTPYLGAGIVANWYFGEKPAGGYVQDFKVASIYAPMIKAGLDYHLQESWFANFEVKQIFLPQRTIENQGVRARSSLDSVSVGLGVSYRF